MKKIFITLVLLVMVFSYGYAQNTVSVVKEVKKEKKESGSCYQCQGLGKQNIIEEKVKCSWCKGLGYTMEPWITEHGRGTMRETCKICNGDKKNRAEIKCSSCNGKGKLYTYNSFEVRYIVVNGEKIEVDKGLDIKFDDFNSTYNITEIQEKLNMNTRIYPQIIIIYSNGDIRFFLRGVYWGKDWLFLEKLQVKLSNGKIMDISLNRRNVVSDTIQLYNSVYCVESFSISYPQELLYDIPEKCRFIGKGYCDADLTGYFSESKILDLYKKIKQVQSKN